MSFSQKSIKYEYQLCLSSTNGSISIDISIIWEAQFKKKPQGQRVNGVRFQKNFGFSIFSAKGKNLTPRQVEIPKLS